MALVSLMLMSALFTHAQSVKKIDLSKALHIGDDFAPPNAVQHMRGADKSIDLKKLNDKVVILDFFDTSCGTCIHTMPKLQKIQDRLKDKLQIITVAWQNRATLVKFFEQNEFLKDSKVNLPVIYSDLYLKERFPHQSVPHVVFLFKGKVQAIAGSDFITDENILDLYNTGFINLPLKDDFGRGDLMGLDKNQVQIKGMSKLSGYQNGVPFESFRRQKDSITGLQKTSFYNVSIYSAVLSTRAKFEKSNYIPRPERLVLNVKDPSFYDDIDNLGDVWYVKNAISYERFDAIELVDSAQARVVLQDLQSFLGIRTYKTMKSVECLILKPGNVKPYKGLMPMDGMEYEGTSVLAVMTDLGRQFPPILDLVKSRNKIQLGNYNNLEELNEQLAVYGIVAEIGMGEQEVLVIEEVE